jgi:hypothetical protein
LFTAIRFAGGRNVRSGYLRTPGKWMISRASPRRWPAGDFAAVSIASLDRACLLPCIRADTVVA